MNTINETSQNEVVNKIHENTDIRREVVKEVLSSLRDVALETVLEKGYFNVAGITIIKRKKNPLRNPELTKVHGSTYIASISRKFRDAIRIQELVFPDKPGIINAQTWEAASKWFWENKDEIEKRKMDPDVVKAREELVKSQEMAMENQMKNLKEMREKINFEKKKEPEEDNPFLMNDDE